MVELGTWALVTTGFGLGLRHGIDWDHIAAITDITASDTDVGTDGARAGSERPTPSHPGASAAVSNAGTLSRESWNRFFLATVYALGHALVVVTLGLLAIWTSSFLPGWVDPIMERLVGVTLVILAIWIFYSLWRHGRQFRLRSRWMLIFLVVGRGWSRLHSRLTGHEHHHHQELRQYGRRTAFGIGMIHGIGAETGTQALLLASAAGATTTWTGSVMLFSFVAGLIASNSFIAALSTFGFVSAHTRQTVYLVIGVVAAVFSLVVGVLFIMGSGTALPDLQRLLELIFGESRVDV